MTFALLSRFDRYHYRWGIYDQEYLQVKYYYAEINMMHSFRNEGYSAIYCDFNVWSENSDFTVWISAFAPNVAGHIRGHRNCGGGKTFGGYLSTS